MGQEEIDKARAKRDLKRVITDSDEVLVTASTIAPIHKNTLTLNRTKLFTEERSAFRGVSVMSVRIEDVLNVNGELGPIGGFIKINTKFTAPDKPHIIGPFHRKDVLKLKRIIQGYVIANQKGIDVNPIPTVDLIPLLYKLGEDDPSLR
jgi:hypothetical protein